jgi:hypothetical protein
MGTLGQDASCRPHKMQPDSLHQYKQAGSKPERLALNTR